MADDDGSRAPVGPGADGVLVHSRGVIRYASLSIVRMLGATSERDLLGRPVMELIHDDDRAAELARQAAAGQKEPVPPATFRLLGFDGRVVAVEATAAAATFQDEPALEVIVRGVPARERDLADETHVRVTRDLVRRILALLGDGSRPGARRELGRALALEARGESERDLMWSFTGLGIGKMRLVSQEGGRYEFEGSDLLEVDDTGRLPSCQLALGFAEGIVERLSKSPALGNEMRCQGQGAASCHFVVKARAKAP